MESHFVFSDITLDNPNVWFEVGYSIAKGKEICFVCSKDRIDEKKKFPFDIQHRNIIVYSGDSRTSWNKLESDIFEILNGINENIQKKNEIALALTNESSSISQKFNGALISEMEKTAMAIVASETPAHEGLSLYSFRKKMEESGYNGIGVNVSYSSLIRKGFCESVEVYDQEAQEKYDILRVTEGGWGFIENKLHVFSTRKHERSLTVKLSEAGNFSLGTTEDEIPF